MVGWLVGWWVGWLVGWLIGWILVGPQGIPHAQWSGANARRPRALYPQNSVPSSSASDAGKLSKRSARVSQHAIHLNAHQCALGFHGSSGISRDSKDQFGQRTNQPNNTDNLLTSTKAHTCRRQNEPTNQPNPESYYGDQCRFHEHALERETQPSFYVLGIRGALPGDRSLFQRRCLPRHAHHSPLHAIAGCVHPATFSRRPSRCC